MKKRGFFISFEGAEAVGKSTQIEMLEVRLLKDGYKVYRTREPGGTELGEKLRKLFKSEEMHPLAELFMVAASRVEHVHQVIQPRLKKGEIILCDRFTTSSLVYQGILGKQDMKRVRTANQWASLGISPDLCIWLDLSLADLHQRLIKRSGPADRFDEKPEAFHQATLKAYQRLARSERKPKLTKFNASMSEDELHEAIYSNVNKALAKAKIRA